MIPASKSVILHLCVCILSLIFTCYSFEELRAQALPQNYSNVSVDELSDQQIRQLISAAQASGQSDNEILQAAQAKGLSSVQVQKLKQRIENLRKLNISQTGTSGVNDQSNGSNQRSVSYGRDSVVRGRVTEEGGMKIFGAELFSGSNTTFEPNLKLATPINYILGPDDQLNISVYGNSVVNWKLNVSSEGNINLPSGGILNVAGKTIEQATAAIRNRLISKNYAIGSGSNLSVTLGNIRSIKVIMIGELVKPGTYTLPSLASAFNALYAAGGPNQTGSFREIEIVRNSRVVRHLDIYNFLIAGSQKDNISLQDQDIIRVPAIRTQVQMIGEVKRNALFEILPGETLADVINFSGGFTNSAYRANVKVSQISDQQRRLTDVTEANFKNYVPLAGDIYTISRILDRFENRVTINGAVFRPGEYELQRNMTLSQLISKASGTKEDAFMELGSITRLNSDNTTQIISFNVKNVINKSEDYSLNREDIINIRSIFDIHEQYTVTISGEVRSPGEFAYSRGMSIENLILQADGFKEGASNLRVEVARRMNNSNPSLPDGPIAHVFEVNIDPNLKPTKSFFELKPFDVVLIYKLPGYEKQGIVRLEGEVLYPGPYVIEKKNERISDIIRKAGGLTYAANVEGGTLRRSFTALLGADKNKVDTISLAREKADRLNSLKSTLKDSTDTEEFVRNNAIGIDLKQILKDSSSVSNLILKDGDVIVVPQQQQVVQVSGQVHVPSSVIYTSSKGFNQYVLEAGGYGDNALRKGAYVIYPNGAVKGTHKFLFFNVHPEVKPGSEIYVPRKPQRRGISVSEFATVISALGSLILIGILSFRK